MTRPTVCVYTLGCKVNRYDSDAMYAVLSSAGIEVSEELCRADVYIVNTCAVTAEAERKSRQSVGKLLKLNPDAEIYVCGCASQKDFSQFQRERVCLISGTDGKIRLARELAARYAVVEDVKESNHCQAENDKVLANQNNYSISDEFEENDGVLTSRTRHFVKVQDGCNNFCSYCIVPYLRGRSRSREIDGILREIEQAQSVAKEIVLTGINLSAYGKDKNTNLASLLRALSAYDMRVRLGSLEVSIIDEELLSATQSLARFCPHFHLSLQSGDDKVLADMNRHYKTDEYKRAVELIRSYYPNVAITTDIIVGFPTENEEQFNCSYNFAKNIGFSDIHVFPYSSRKGTVAGRLKPLPPTVVNARAKQMAELKQELQTKYLTAQIGRECEVLFENQVQTAEGLLWCGHTPNYVKVYAPSGERNTLSHIVPTRLFEDGVR